MQGIGSGAVAWPWPAVRFGLIKGAVSTDRPEFFRTDSVLSNGWQPSELAKNDSTLAKNDLHRGFYKAYLKLAEKVTQSPLSIKNKQEKEDYHDELFY
jgi:hypothetical protein